MDPFTLGLVGLVVMVGLIFLGVPIAISLGVVGLAGNAILTGLPRSGMQLQLVVWEMTTNFLLITVPLFIFMGQLVFHTGIARDMFGAVYRRGRHREFGRVWRRHRIERRRHRHHGQHGDARDAALRL